MRSRRPCHQVMPRSGIGTNIHGVFLAFLSALWISAFANPASDAGTIEIRTEQGTWMGIAVTPDGRHLVFDLLGSIYQVPLTGGKAELLVGGYVAGFDGFPAAAVSHSPAVSATGRIAFISDLSGSENVWVLDAPGSAPRQVTHHDGLNFNSPVWSEDGGSILVRRSTTGREGELWQYDVATGKGERLPLNDRIVDLEGPAVHEGELYFASPLIGEGRRPLRRETWQIMRAEPASETVETVSDVPGGAVRPLISPNGRWLAYGTWRDGKSSLALRDLSSGEEQILLSGVPRNLQDMYIAQLDLLPGYAFAPDSSAIFIGRDGRLTRVAVPSGDVSIIDFEVEATVHVPQAKPDPVAVPEAGFTPRMLRWPQAGADGSVIFEAIGRLWSIDTDDPGRKPEPLTPPELFATQPDVMPDGRIAFLATDAEGGRAILLREPDGTVRKVTDYAAAYAAPRFTADGAQLLAVKAGKGVALGMVSPTRRSATVDLVRLNPATGEEAVLLTGALTEAGVWETPDGAGFWLSTEEGLTRASRDTEVGPVGPVAIDRGGADLIVPSPDGSRVAVAMNNHVFVVPVAEAAPAIRDLTANPPPYARFPGEHGYFPSWIDDDTLLWSIPRGIATAPADRLEDARRIVTEFQVRPSVNKRSVALRGARLLTMSEPPVIEAGEIVIDEGRLACIAPLGGCDVPDNAVVRDMSGKTIMPGLIDVHQHALALMGEASTKGIPGQYPPASILLAYGVTSTRDPALLSNIRDFSLIESINAGRVSGPRHFATGERVMPERVTISGLDDARAIVTDLTAVGATSIKEYLLRDRRQRQWLRAAAAEAGVRITFEGGYDYKLSLGAVLDGYDGVEHSAGNHILHDDFIGLMAATGIDYTPTILTQIGAEVFYRRYDIRVEERLRRFVGLQPLEYLMTRPRRGQGVAPEETAYRALTVNAARAQRAGVTVCVGAHDSPAPTGLGTHWEIWSLVEGGMSEEAALRAATIAGARVIGIEEHVGTLERGKIADLLILQENPLEDIHNTLSLETVVRNGHLLDSKTLEPVGFSEGS